MSNLKYNSLLSNFSKQASLYDLLHTNNHLLYNHSTKNGVEQPLVTTPFLVEWLSVM